MYQEGDEPARVACIAPRSKSLPFHSLRIRNSPASRPTVLSLHQRTRYTYAAGLRSTEQVRIEEGSNFHTLFRSDGHGGLFLQCLKKYYYPDTQVGTPLHPSFLAQRIVPFITELRG